MLPGKAKNLIELIVVFCLTWPIFYPGTNNYCRIASDSGFDSQNLYVWDHLPRLGYQPNRETFYPYGFLFFYKAQSMPWFIIYSLLIPLFFTVIYLTIVKRIIKSKLVGLIYFLSLITLFLNNLWVGNAARYFISLALSLLSAYLIYDPNHKKSWPFFILGLIGGFSLLVSTGDGLYVIFIQILLICFAHLFPFSKRLFSNLFRYFGGLLLGLIPLLIHLYSQALFPSFVQSLRDLVDLSIFAKAPYSLNTISEIFIFISLSIAFVAFFLRFIHPKLRHTYSTLILFAGLLSLLVLEQKNLIRQFGLIMMVYAFIMDTFIFFFATKRLFVSNKFTQIKIILLYIIFFWSFIESMRLTLNPFEIVNQVKAINYSTPKLCPVNPDFDRLQLPESYSQVKDYLKAQPDLQAIFSYPYDPIFYLLVGTKLPPYPTVYEATPISAQAKNLKFLEDNQVNYVIYNPLSFPIDGTPEYVRTQLEEKYLLTHFVPVKQIGSFYVLKKSEGIANWFTKGNLKAYPELLNHLLNLNFASLPVAATGSALLIDFGVVTQATGSTLITTSNGWQTKVIFNLKPQVTLPLDSMPLFFTPRDIKSILITPPPVLYHIFL